MQTTPCVENDVPFRVQGRGRGRGNVAAERLCGALFVGLTTLKGYFYINLGGTQNRHLHGANYSLCGEDIPAYAC